MTEVAPGSAGANDAMATVADAPPTPELKQLQTAHAEAVTAAEGAQRKVTKLRAFLAEAEAVAEATLKAVDEAATAVGVEVERIQHETEQARARLTGAEGGA